MNVIPVITLFGGLSAFFALAVTMRVVLSKTQGIDKQDENQLAGS